MYLLDTDTLALILRGNSPNIAARLRETPARLIWISVVTVEEILKGRLSIVQKARDGRTRSGVDLPKAYDLLLQSIEELRRFKVLPYTSEASAPFGSWSATVKRVGTQDCRIAAIAVTNNFTVVTRNIKDFSAIGDPRLRVVDWSV